MHGTSVTTDKIFAAVCVYLLIGLAWTFAYALVDALNPHSFVALSAAGHEKYIIRVLELRYFSFMTLTTVGYGDIVPHSTAARTLAALEAIVGQIYLTVLVARLVGLHSSTPTVCRRTKSDVAIKANLFHSRPHPGSSFSRFAL